MSIFNAVTYDFDDLVKSIEIKNQHEDDLKTKHIRTVRSQQYGRFSEITLSIKQVHSLLNWYLTGACIYFRFSISFPYHSRSSKIINTGQ